MDRAERQHEGPPAREWRPVLGRVTGRAIGGAGQILAALHGARGLEFRRHAGGIALRVGGERDPLAAGKIGGMRAKCIVSGDDDRKDDDGGENPQNRPRIFGGRRVHGHQLLTSLLENGNTYTRLPVAAKTALATAGPISAPPGSATTVRFFMEGTIYTHTFWCSILA